MLAFIATLSVKPEKVEEFKSAMAAVAPKVREEPGNHAYVGHQSPDDPTEFVFYEQYDDQDAIQAHRANLGAQGIDLQAMLTGPPTLKFLDLL